MHTHCEWENTQSSLLHLTRRAIWKYFDRCVLRHPAFTYPHPFIPTQKEMACRNTFQQTHTGWWQKRHYSKWNSPEEKCFTQLIVCDEPALAHFDLLHPYLSHNLHFIYSNTIRKIPHNWAFFSCVFLSHKSFNISPAAKVRLIASTNMLIWKVGNFIYSLFVYNCHAKIIYSIWNCEIEKKKKAQIWGTTNSLRMSSKPW